MPRKPKDEEVSKIEKEAVKKVATSKKATSKKSTAKTEKPVSKSSASKKSVSTKAVATTTKTTKKTTNTKKATTKKAATKKTTTKKTDDTKKASSTKSTSAAKKSNNTTKKTTTKRTSKKSAVPAEYYDLPSVYSKTVVKILAQTPSCLFVYWEISDLDKLNYKKQYGEGFFQNTKPYLIVINETKNYSFEIEINDYANSWYIHVNDSDCKYNVKLIRKPINNEVSISVPSIDISSSNEINSPNDHILFDRLGKTVFFRNVKSNIVSKKDISSLSFISNIGRIYNIYDLYKEIYKDELTGNELGASLSSSQFSSWFK